VQTNGKISHCPFESQRFDRGARTTLYHIAGRGTNDTSTAPLQQSKRLGEKSVGANGGAFIASSKDGVTRKEIMEYVSVAMPVGRTEEQKLRILGNLLKEMKDDGRIHTQKQHWYITIDNECDWKRLKQSQSDYKVPKL